MGVGISVNRNLFFLYESMKEENCECCFDFCSGNESVKFLLMNDMNERNFCFKICILKFFFAVGFFVGE